MEERGGVPTEAGNDFHILYNIGDKNSKVSLNVAASRLILFVSLTTIALSIAIYRNVKHKASTLHRKLT